MRAVQDQLNFSIDTPSDEELVRRFADERAPKIEPPNSRRLRLTKSASNPAKRKKKRQAQRKARRMARA